jgi:hypothetical protein
VQAREKWTVPRFVAVSSSVARDSLPSHPSEKEMVVELIFGVLLVALSAVLLFIGLPDKNGTPPQFLRFEAAVVLYPPVVMAAFVMGLAELISAYVGLK